MPYKENIAGIYKIQSVCKPERVYIGSAISIKRRWVVHRWDLRNNRHSSKMLQRHHDKYGFEDLQFSIILSGCKPEDLIFLEQIFITPKPYFNSNPTAGSRLGHKLKGRSKNLGMKYKKHKVLVRGPRQYKYKPRKDIGTHYSEERLVKHIERVNRPDYKENMSKSQIARHNKHRLNA